METTDISKNVSFTGHRSGRISQPLLWLYADMVSEIKSLYASFCEGEIVVTDIRTAEMTKVVENTFRDINIAFANELAKICRSDNMDVYEIIRIANPTWERKFYMCTLKDVYQAPAINDFKEFVKQHSMV